MSHSLRMLPEAPALPTLATERLLVRWLTPADVPALYAIFSDPAVMRYWNSPPLVDQEAAAALLADIERLFAARALFKWGVARREDDQVIGTCTLGQLSAEHRRAELGYALGRAHWGRGYMREALVAVIAFAFGSLALHRLEADVHPRNERSIRLLEGLGFRREGYLRERYHVAGEVSDTVLLGLLAREWSP